MQPTAVMTSQQPGSNVTLVSGWRTDPFILLFNKVASTMMQAYGIPTVDIYSIASPLFDMSYDATHYIGTVGLAQAEMVADIVCDDLGVFVTREHVRHNKSGIAHRGRTGINH
jgi:hypothetical protein